MLRRVLTYALFFFVLWQVRFSLPAILSVFTFIIIFGGTFGNLTLVLLKKSEQSQTLNNQINSLVGKHYVCLVFFCFSVLDLLKYLMPTRV